MQSLEGGGKEKRESDLSQDSTEQSILCIRGELWEWWGEGLWLMFSIFLYWMHQQSSVKVPQSDVMHLFVHILCLLWKALFLCAAF